MKLPWQDFKGFFTSRGVSPQYVKVGAIYWLKAFDSVFDVECELSPARDSAGYAEFESVYKSQSNKPVTAPVMVQSLAPFGDKIITVNGVKKKLFASNIGVKQFVTTGANIIEITINKPWVKMTGAEVVGSETLDTVTFKVLDTPAGTYSGVANKVLSQFATTQNVVKDLYQYTSIYDADLYLGLRVVVEYTSLSDKTVGINLFLNEVVAA
jgi:hypothetical protein